MVGIRSTVEIVIAAAPTAAYRAAVDSL